MRRRGRREEAKREDLRLTIIDFVLLELMVRNRDDNQEDIRSIIRLHLSETLRRSDRMREENVISVHGEGRRWGEGKLCEIIDVQNEQKGTKDQTLRNARVGLNFAGERP